MIFIATVIGMVVGAVFFSMKNSFILGGIIGGLISFLLTKITLLEDRLATLEKKLKPQTVPKASPALASTSKKITTAPTTSEPKEIPELDFNIIPEDNPPQQVAAKLSSKPAADQNQSPSSPVNEKSYTLEWWDIIVSYFTGGNVVARVGIIVIFFGVAFLLKYSVERNIIPIEYRLASICLGAIAMLIFGWRLRQTRTIYALILQGGGIGVMYLTIFAALKLYGLIPLGVALGLLVALPVFAAFLAIIQEARALAVIGIIGGFLAPVLTSTGGGSHIVLFSYYALLNGGILLTAWHRSWRELNLIGFIFTFAIGAAWGARSFKPEMFVTTEPFLILFFLFYLAIGLLFASKQPLRHKGYIDCSMVFGTPIICFAIQSRLVEPYEYGLAWSALAMATIYASLAWLVFRRGSEAMRTMVESFMAMGVVFGTVAIPLALDGRWTSTAWALEGSAIIWIAIRQDRHIARIFGLGMQILAGLSFLSALNDPDGPVAVINGFYLGTLIIALAGFFSSYCLFTSRDKIKTADQESILLLVWALLWWFGAGLHEIDTFVDYYYKLAATLSFCSLSVLASYIIAEKLRWPDLKHVYKGLLAVMSLGAFYHFTPSLLIPTPTEDIFPGT